MVTLYDIVTLKDDCVTATAPNENLVNMLHVHLRDSCSTLFRPLSAQKDGSHGVNGTARMMVVMACLELKKKKKKMFQKNSSVYNVILNENGDCHARMKNLLHNTRSF
jgi:hypothetical protein